MYKNKKVLILGLGLNQGGIGSTRFFAKAGAEVRVTDLKSAQELKPSLDELKNIPNITYILGEHRYEDIDWAGLIIKNPGIKLDNPYVKYALDKNKKVDSDIGIFFQLVPPEKIIGVTGTKGKSTTASLIYQALHKAGIKVLFAGNIGRSVFDTLPLLQDDSYVILELSSYQLESLDIHKVSPKWAVITNIYPDHISFHGSMENYIEAKKVITKYQGEDCYLFINSLDQISNSDEFKKGIKSKIVTFSGQELPSDFQPLIPGAHNRDNYACTVAVSKTFGISSSQTLHYIKDFQGVEFRLQLVKKWNGIKIYNDTAATAPQAAALNIKTFKNCIWIGGGVNKNLPYEDLARTIDEFSRIVYLLEGDASDAILKSLKKKEKIKGIYNNLENLLTDVKKEVKEGDVVLFSPGAASFNLFKNEFDRGEKFNQAVNKIFN